MESELSNMDNKSKIELALSYENIDIVNKISREHNLSYEMGKDYFIELKKFLYLCSSTNEILAPSNELDKIWHTFILHTKEYRLYCTQYLGKFIDHVPKGEYHDPASTENFLVNTLIAYEEVFGELNNEIWQIEDYDDDCSDCSKCESNQKPSSSGDTGGNNCVYSGSCFNCANSGQSCVGENPNDLS